MTETSGTTATLKARLRADLTTAMKARDALTTGTIRLALAAITTAEVSGTTAKELVKDLAGKGEVRFTDGEIEGADLVAISRVVQSVVTLDALGAAVGNSAKTPFGRMGASFVIDKGVLHTNDFALINPAVEMNGRGDVDLSAETLEFHFVPKAVKGLPGLKLVDLGVPFYVKGPWNKPGYGPDARALAKTIVEKLETGATSPLDLIKNPGLSLKSIFGTQKSTTK